MCTTRQRLRNAAVQRSYAAQTRCVLQVCREGKRLGPHQATLLRHLDIKMAVFRLKLRAGLDKDGNFWEYDDGFSEEDEDEAAGGLASDPFDDGLPDSVMLPAALRAAQQ